MVTVGFPPCSTQHGYNKQLLDNFAIRLHNIRMWIARDGETLIRQLSKQFPAVFVTGARQVGKTSILTHLFPENSYVTLDDPDKAAFAENAPADFLHSLAYPVIIDEAQYAPGLFRHIKIIIDKGIGNLQDQGRFSPQ